MEKKAGKKETHDKKPETKKESHKEHSETKPAHAKAHHDEGHAHAKKEHHDEGHAHAKKEHHDEGHAHAKAKTAKSKDASKETEHTHESTPHPMPKQQCKIQGCKREYRAKGYCRVHYRKWRHGEYGRARFKTCKDFGCNAAMALNRHGFCEEHFQNYYVKGMEQARVPAEKPAAKVEPKSTEKVA